MTDAAASAGAAGKKKLKSGDAPVKSKEGATDTPAEDSTASEMEELNFEAGASAEGRPVPGALPFSYALRSLPSLGGTRRRTRAGEHLAPRDKVGREQSKETAAADADAPASGSEKAGIVAGETQKIDEGSARDVAEVPPETGEQY